MTDTIQKMMTSSKLNLHKLHLFTKKAQILEAKNMQQLRQLIKENIKAPNEDKKVFVVTFSFVNNSDKPFKFVITQYTITPTLGLITKEGDYSQTFTYTPEEFQIYGFKLSYITDITKLYNQEVRYSRK
jgi:hypothetical protein